MRYRISLTLLLLFPNAALGQPGMPEVQIVFLTPGDVEPPEGVTRRLTQVADCAEALFVKWMKAWEYPPQRERIFQRKADGSVKVWFVKAEETLASGEFPLEGGNLARKGKLLAMEEYGLAQDLDVWWVWVYVGDPPMKYATYLGSGNAATGGLCVVNYVNLPGEIVPQMNLAGDAVEKLMVKGCIHEFGHALGLPHSGPLEKDDLGMPLMGATVRNYRARMKNNEERVCLTQDSAAILWKHPLFSGTPERRYAMPNIRWHDISVRNDRSRRIARLVGRVTSSVPVHSVIVYDTVPEVQANYFQKAYVARVEKDGAFEVVITEPVTMPVSGSFKLVACCGNGTMTGDGESRGIGGAHEIAYRTSRTGYRLTR